MSSQDVIRTVSKKLKYYFEVKRLEDGFDLSGPECPKLDHPHHKARSTLQYDGLHDRPLKHYFSPHDIRVALTNFNVPYGMDGREKAIRRALQSYMKKFHFVDPVPPPKPDDNNMNPAVSRARARLRHASGSSRSSSAPSGGRHGRPKSARTAGRVGKPSNLPDQFYTKLSGEKKLRKEATGFGVPVRKKKAAYKGGYPTLRTMPSKFVTPGEARRLVNIATRLLIATETIDLKSGQRTDSPTVSETDSLPQIKSRPKSKADKAYVYDTRGRRVRIKSRRSEAGDDSAYCSPPDSATPTAGNDDEDGNLLPSWLRREMQRIDINDEEQTQWVRPHSTTPTPPPQPLPMRSPEPPQSPRSGSSGSTSARSEASVQTGGELLKHYDPMDTILTDGERTTYEVRVATGNRLGASTKADIKVVLCGDKGRTEEILLKDSLTYKIKFQRGQEDIFRLDTFYVGPLRQIFIGHDRIELGYGWFCERIQVRDLTNRMQYSVPCDRWFSSREGDGRTFRQIAVDTSQSLGGASEDNQSRRSRSDTQSETPIRYEAAKDLVTEAATSPGSDAGTDRSHTSLDTNYSDRKQAERRSSSSSATVTSAQSESETEEDEPVKIPPAPPKPMRRRDTFFDQRQAGPDYTSVIDSLSQSTEQDNAHDFDTDKPTQTYRQNSYTGPRLAYGGETARFQPAEVHGDEKTTTTVRLSLNDTKAEEQVKYLDGFKAGLEAAQHSTQSTSDDSSNTPVREHDELKKGPTVNQTAKNGDLSRVKKLIEHSPNLKQAKDEMGWMPLHNASAGGHTEIVKWLAVAGVNMDAETPTGYMAMHLAAMHGHTNTMIVLNAMGAKIGSKSVEQQTPLHVAAMRGHLESVKWLVANRASLDVLDNVGRTPEKVAEEYYKMDVVEFLRSCAKEQKNPKSSFTLLRENSKSSLSDSQRSSDSGKVTPRPLPPAQQEGTWQNEYAKSPPPPEDSDDDTASSTASSETETSMSITSSKKHDEELMEKRRLYEEQKHKMEKQNVSFLDSVRADYDDQ